jgi:hypothetical protein
LSHRRDELVDDTREKWRERGEQRNVEQLQEHGCRAEDSEQEINKSGDAPLGLAALVTETAEKKTKTKRNLVM